MVVCLQKSTLIFCLLNRFSGNAWKTDFKFWHCRVWIHSWTVFFRVQEIRRHRDLSISPQLLSIEKQLSACMSYVHIQSKSWAVLMKIIQMIIFGTISWSKVISSLLFKTEECFLSSRMIKSSYLCSFPFSACLLQSLFLYSECFSGVELFLT